MSSKFWCSALVYHTTDRSHNTDSDFLNGHLNSILVLLYRTEVTSSIQMCVADGLSSLYLVHNYSVAY